MRAQARGDAVFVGVSALTADHAQVRQLRDAGATLFMRPANSIYRGARDSFLRNLPWQRSRHLEGQLSRFAPDLVLITQGATYDALAEHHLVGWLHRHRVPYIAICHNNDDAGQVPSGEDVTRLRAYFDGAAHTLFVSTHNLRLAERHLGGPLPRTQLIQNPLATLASAALPAPPPGPIPVIGMVGRLDIHHKGIDLLLAAVAGLPPDSVRIVLTGRIEDAAALSALIARHGLQSCIEVNGPVPASEVIKAYGRLELFLLTSRYEGCASAMIESMMCGRPVLATNVGGVSDWIEDGVNGFIVPAPTVESIRATLARALAERSRWPQLGSAARAGFDRQRDPDPVASLLDLVDRAVKAA